MNERKEWRQLRREFQDKRRETRKVFVPAYGSWKWYMSQWKYRGGQAIRYYLRDNVKVFPRVIRWGWERFRYGVSFIDYVDFDDSLLTYVYNNLLAMRRLGVSVPGRYAENHKEWERQLDGALLMLREHLAGPDGPDYPDMSLLFNWISENLWDLWD